MTCLWTWDLQKMGYITLCLRGLLWINKARAKDKKYIWVSVLYSLLWIDKARAKDKRYKEVSVWWKTKTKTKEFTRLPYTGLVLELEHLGVTQTKMFALWKCILEKKKTEKRRNNGKPRKYWTNAQRLHAKKTYAREGTGEHAHSLRRADHHSARSRETAESHTEAARAEFSQRRCRKTEDGNSHRLWGGDLYICPGFVLVHRSHPFGLCSEVCSVVMSDDVLLAAPGSWSLWMANKKQIMNGSLGALADANGGYPIERYVIRAAPSLRVPLHRTGWLKTSCSSATRCPFQNDSKGGSP
jgi:hypothetical protein